MMYWGGDINLNFFLMFRFMSASHILGEESVAGVVGGGAAGGGGGGVGIGGGGGGGGAAPAATVSATNAARP